MYTHIHICTLSVRWILDKIASPEQTVRLKGTLSVPRMSCGGFHVSKGRITRVAIRIPVG